MSLVNRSAEYAHLYDSEGRLQGGLSSLEELAQVIAIGAGNGRDQDAMDADNDDIEPAQEFPISGASRDSSLIDSDDDMSGDDEPGSSDDDAMEDIAMYDEPHSMIISPSPRELPAAQSPTLISSSPTAFAASTPPDGGIRGSAPSPPNKRDSWSSDSDNSTTRPRSSNSRRSTRRSNTLDVPVGPPVLGERLKQRFLETNVSASLLVSHSFMTMFPADC